MIIFSVGMIMFSVGMIIFSVGMIIFFCKSYNTIVYSYDS